MRLCCGCATTTTSEPSPAVKAQVIAVALENKARVEALTGRQFKDWTKADTQLWQAMNLRDLLQITKQDTDERAAQRQAMGQAVANGFHQAGESIRQGAQMPVSQPQVNISQPPRQYIRQNAITGQLETVTDYGNGFQNVWPVRQ